MICIDIVLLAVLLAADQLTKYLIRSKLALREYFSVIDGVLQIYHYENTGAVWGIMKGQRIFFILLAFVVGAGIVFALCRIPDEKKYIRMNIALIMVAAGAVGNTIDRMIQGSVTDFIYVVLINFPIFNVADMYIVIATFWLMFMVIFIYKDEDLAVFSFRKDK